MDIVKLLTENLSSMDSVKFGYIFGSYASCKHTDRSDIDIALFLNDTSFDTLLQINYEISKLLKNDVDLIILNNIKNIYLLENILKNGIIIKDNDKRFDFEILSQHNILDFKAFRRYIDAA